MNLALASRAPTLNKRNLAPCFWLVGSTTVVLGAFTGSLIALVITLVTGS